MSDNELAVMIKELRELQALAEEANAEIESLKDSIKAYMGDTEELRAGEYKGPGSLCQLSGWTQRL